MDNVKLKNNRLYGKFKDQPIYLDTDFEMEGMNMEMTYEEIMLANRIGKALGMDNEKVGRTSHVELMRMLAGRVETLNTMLKIADETIEAIENYIKKNGR